MTVRSRTSTLVPILAIAVLLLGAPQAGAYSNYAGANNCQQCHPGFLGGFGAPLHDLHLNMTSDCLHCHTVIGDNPNLQSSGNGVGCIGCHIEEGLRAHHTNAGAPADGNGLFCVNCHPGDPAPAPENTLPPYYGLPTVGLTDPCATDILAGGEDYSGSGFGLDNDGDLAYDGADPDCFQAIPTLSSWGMGAMMLVLLAVGFAYARRRRAFSS